MLKSDSQEQQRPGDPTAKGVTGVATALKSPSGGKDLRAQHIEKTNKQRVWPFTDQIGNAPVIRSEYLERILGIKHIYLKLECENVTGTHKVIGAMPHVLRAKQYGFTEIIAASCGDYGEALAWCAAQGGIKCKIFMPRDNQQTPTIVRHISEHCPKGFVEFVLTPGKEYTGAYVASERYVDENRRYGVYNANAGAFNNVDPRSGRTPVSHDDGTVLSNMQLDMVSYGKMGEEGVEALAPRIPTVLIVPAANAVTGLAIHAGCKSKGVSSRLVLATSENRMIKDRQRGRYNPEPPDKEDFTIRAENECLAGNIALLGKQGVETAEGSGGDVLGISIKKLVRAAKIGSDAIAHDWHPYGSRHNVKITLMPSGAAAIGCMIQHATRFREMREANQQQGIMEENYLLYITGKFE